MRTERAAVLCRVSTVGQEQDGTSLDHQERECRAHCDGRGYAVVMVESEQGSGAARTRPGLRRVLAAVERGEVDLVVSLALDRLSRKQTHVAVIADICEANEARLEFVTEDFEEGSVGTFRGLGRHVQRARSARSFAGRRRSPPSWSARRSATGR